jgi:Bacterial regulatory proteins, luxR family
VPACAGPDGGRRLACRCAAPSTSPSAPAPPGWPLTSGGTCSRWGRGLSNRQIAEHLFVTQATVETHLRHAFRKLGVTSRAGLPAQLAGCTAGDR